MSKTRKMYFLRLAGRIAVLICVLMLYMFKREDFSVIGGWGFFKKFSYLHILWAIWMFDMLLQLMPVKAHISIGSQKIFQTLFRPIKEKISYTNLKNYIRQTTASAYKVMIVWIILNIVIGIMYANGTIDPAIVLLICTFFYVCDLICVVIWCPFRLIMGNKCCTTCRIFNWDHLMMFSPFATVFGVYSSSLFVFSFVIWLIWEICVFTYPERFWENSNMALRCSECTDKLCTQYCRKLRTTHRS